MDFIKIYSDILKKNINNPEKIKKMLKFGYNLEHFNLKFIGDKELPKSLRYLSKLKQRFITSDNAVIVCINVHS